jgi:hypothetical protein
MFGARGLREVAVSRTYKHLFFVVLLIGLVAALVVPAGADRDDNMIVGRANGAKKWNTSLYSTNNTATLSLFNKNGSTGAPALRLHSNIGPALEISSDDWIENLNADLLDGNEAAAFSMTTHDHDTAYAALGHDHAGVYALVAHGHDHGGLTGLGDDDHTQYFHLGQNETVTGQPAFDGGDGSTAPFTVDSDFKVTDLNADLLDGSDSTDFVGTADHTKAAHDALDIDADTLDGMDSSAFRNTGAQCPPGETLTGYGRFGPTCSSAVGSVSVDTTGNVGEHTSLVLDASGYPVISYYDNTGDDLKLARCHDATCSSSTITTVDSTGTVGEFSSLVLDASGYPVIAYYDNTSDDLKLAHCGDATCSSGNTINTVDSSESVGDHTSLALDAMGYPVISYRQVTHNDLRLAHCGDANCSSGNTLTTVDNTGTMGWHTSLVLDASGYPVISYLDAGTDDLRVAHCGDANCTSGNTLTTVASTGQVGWYNSLALDAAGYPVVSYYDATNDELKVVHCGDANCSSGNTTNTVDSNGNVGWDSSMVLDESGYPVVSYYSWTSFDLMLAHCNDANCATATIFTVDSPGDVGQHSALVLDSSGNPVISYYDITNTNLKLAAMVG